MTSKKGGKRGRKAATGIFDDLKNKKLGELSYNDCMSLTLQNIRKTSAYKELTPSPRINIRKEGKGVYRFGCKSTASKQKLCTFLSNPQIYYDVVENANKQRKIKDRKLYKKRDRTGQRIGLCIPKKRHPTPSGACSKDKDYTHKGLTTTGVDCCFKRKQSTKIREERLGTRGKKLYKVPSNKELSNEIKSILNNRSQMSRVSKKDIYRKLQNRIFKVELTSKKKFIYREIQKQIESIKKIRSKSKSISSLGNYSNLSDSDLSISL